MSERLSAPGCLGWCRARIERAAPKLHASLNFRCHRSGYPSGTRGSATIPGMREKRVLILSDQRRHRPRPRGAGAGKGLRRAIRGVGQVVHEDALKYTNKLFREFYSTLYTKLVRDRADAPRLRFYRASDEPWKSEPARHAIRPPEYAGARQVHPGLRSAHHRLHAFHAGGHHLAPHREGGVADPSLHRRHRFGLSRPLAGAPVQPLLRRDRRNQGAPGSHRLAGGAHHRFGHPHRPDLHRARRSSRGARQLWLASRSNHPAPLRRRAWRQPGGNHRRPAQGPAARRRRAIVICGRKRGAPARSAPQRAGEQIRASAPSASPIACTS